MKNAFLKTSVRATKRGMSLIEIVVVLAILGILATIIGGSMLGALDSSNQDATRLAISRVQSALDMYAAKHKGKYPSTSDGLGAAKTLMPNSEVPTDAWGTAFFYKSPHGWNDCADKYVLISYGADKQEGGESDFISCYMNSEPLP